MGRPKGKATKSNRYWSKEEKLRIVTRIVDHEKSLSVISKEEEINPGQASIWVKKFLENGEQGLINKIKPGSPLLKYQNKNQLTNEEQLQYELMKLKVENERLKKGYIVEGDGQVVVFNILKNKNME
jgi:transposase-like protein